MIPTKPSLKTTNPRYEGYSGFYSLGVHGTITPECGMSTDWFLPQQALALDAVKGWFDQDQHHARYRMNVISADFIEKSRLVEYAIAMNWEMD